MGFQIVGAPEQIETCWCNVVKGDTVYAGQIVRNTDEGVAPLLVASGIGDRAYHLDATGPLCESGNNQPFGIVLGTNARTPAFDTTQQAEEMVELIASSSTSDSYFGVEGPLAVNGQRDSMVEVALIYPHTRIRGPIFNAALGTAISKPAITSGASINGATSATTTCVPVTSMATIYFASGAAAGQYRICDDTSATIHTWDAATTGTPAVGDLVKKVSLRPHGISRCYIDSEAMYIDNSATLTTNYMIINVLKLDLSVDAREYVEFNFNVCHFSAIIEAS